MDMIDEEDMKEHLAEEMAKYEDEGYFKRLVKMFAGLGKKHSSREYKEAVIELQRQAAPLIAILVPVIGAIVLFVVTAMDTTSEQKIDLEIAEAEKPEELDKNEPSRQSVAFRLQNPDSELGSPKYRGTKFWPSQILLIGDLLL